ncbi:E3 ubiquitin-protein ligase MBR1-like [Rutidosis leptorrhynchoides]|uniref:E3 ubiquitin-protein ligase MBR1-like n=1 Tax=Rutidosis leptorrhynchoides TaxID=125765 RepID=UPI003A9978DF
MENTIPENAKQRTPRINSESREGVARRKKVFGFLSMGCGRISSPAVAVVLPEKTRRRKKNSKKKKQRKNRGACSENVCCTPPGIGFAYDVAQSTSSDAHRRNHRQRSSNTRQVTDSEQQWRTTQVNDATFVRSNISDSRQFNRSQNRSHGQISEIVMVEHDPLLEGRLEGSDRFGAWRINADLMSYEELVELSERIGFVDGGLLEEEILDCLKRPKKSFFKSLDFKTKVKDSKCSICQEECKGYEDLGKLECGHYHHLDCIKQWLLRKNECPICKTVAKPNK